MEVEAQRLGQPLSGGHAKAASEENLKSRLITLNNIILALSLILKVAMFITGLATLKNCPSQRLIPIYLAVAGGFGIMLGVAIVVNRPRLTKIIKWIIYVLLVVDFIWMALGLYWIFSVFKEYYYSDYEFHCSESLYLFAAIFAIAHALYFLFFMIAKMTNSSLLTWDVKKM